MTMDSSNGIFGITRQRGIAIVEMVIALPVILLLMLMVAEFGRVFYQYSTLNKAVRDGARYVAGTAVFGSTGTVQLTSAVVNETKSLVTTGNLGPPCLVCCPCNGVKTIQKVVDFL